MKGTFIAGTLWTEHVLPEKDVQDQLVQEHVVRETVVQESIAHGYTNKNIVQDDDIQGTLYENM